MFCGSHIKVWNLFKPHKKKTKNIKMLDLLMKNLKLRIWCSLFHFFVMWFSRFQILVCEPQSIWRKVLVLSWLYLHILWDFEYISQDLIALFLHWLAVFASPDFVLSKCLCFFDILLQFFLIQHSFLPCQFFHPDLYHIFSRHASAK